MTATVPDVRVSLRDIRESAYRALRAVGMPSGVADDAADDALTLEVEHHAGVALLADVLARPHLPTPDLTGTDHLTLDGPGQLLLLARPLVDLAFALPARTLLIHGARDALPVLPALTIAAVATGSDICGSASGRCVVHAGPDGTIRYDPRPVGSLHVQVDPPRHLGSGAPLTAPDRQARWAAAADAGVTITNAVWTTVHDWAARYLV